MTIQNLIADFLGGLSIRIFPLFIFQLFLSSFFSWFYLKFKNNSDYSNEQKRNLIAICVVITALSFISRYSFTISIFSGLLGLGLIIRMFQGNETIKWSAIILIALSVLIGGSYIIAACIVYLFLMLILYFSILKR